MNPRDYFNHNGEPLYVLHFPGDGLAAYSWIMEDNLCRKFTVSKDLSIISIMNYNYWKDSPLRMQCENNGVKLYNSALDENNWANPKKIDYILKNLGEIKTKYTLILDGRDVCICNDLDDAFLEKFKSLGYPIVYNGTPVPFPDVMIEPIQETIKIKGKQKYLNAGVCIGETKELIDFYNIAKTVKENNSSYESITSEQYLIRLARRQAKDKVFWDTHNKIFRICHIYDTKAVEEDNKVTLI